MVMTMPTTVQRLCEPLEALRSLVQSLTAQTCYRSSTNSVKRRHRGKTKDELGQALEELKMLQLHRVGIKQGARNF